MTKVYSFALPTNEFLTIIVVIFLLVSPCDEPSQLQHEWLEPNSRPVTDFYNVTGKGVRYRTGASVQAADGSDCLFREDVTDSLGDNTFEHLWEQMAHLQDSKGWLDQMGDFDDHTHNAEADSAGAAEVPSPTPSLSDLQLYDSREPSRYLSTQADDLANSSRDNLDDRLADDLANSVRDDLDDHSADYLANSSRHDLDDHLADDLANSSRDDLDDHSVADVSGAPSDENDLDDHPVADVSGAPSDENDLDDHPVADVSGEPSYANRSVPAIERPDAALWHRLYHELEECLEEMRCTVVEVQINEAVSRVGTGAYRRSEYFSICTYGLAASPYLDPSLAILDQGHRYSVFFAKDVNHALGPLLEFLHNEGVDVRNCQYVKWTCMVVLVTLWILSLPMMFVVTKYVMNRCGDTFHVQNQFDIEFSSDESDDDWDPATSRRRTTQRRSADVSGRSRRSSEYTTRSSAMNSDMLSEWGGGASPENSMQLGRGGIGSSKKGKRGSCRRDTDRRDTDDGIELGAAPPRGW